MSSSPFRSEEMCLCQLYLQTEAAYACVAELGELSLVQFRDLNPDVSAFQRKFVNEVRRCDEMERKLRYLEKEIRKDAIPTLDTGENPDAPQPREMIDLEATFDRLENELREVNANEEMLKKNYLELTELKHILRKTQAFFDEADWQTTLETSMGTTVATVEPAGETLAPAAADAALRRSQDAPIGSFVAGVIGRDRLIGFERLLWRATHGNVFVRKAEITEPLEDPATGDQVNKSVFIIFFQGEQLKQKVKKICDGYRATLYPCPETPAERREMSMGVMTRIEDLNTVLGQTQEHRHRVLVAAAKNLRMWFTKVRKIKAIYHTLNLFSLDVTSKALVAECWCPVADLERIQLALQRGTEESGSTVPSILNRMETKEQPPTYHKTNKITQGFQNIVDAYGMAKYREINPAPYTVITFPFLFAVMFGDMGHGMIMLLFGLFLVINEKKLEARRIRDEIFQMFFGGRYVILLMGAFSIYTGLIYNDIFSKSISIFRSEWNPNDQKGLYGYVHDFNRDKKMEIMLDPKETFSGSPYPLGIDPVWNLASNRLMFLNSFKMKMSVILGVMQMTFGIFLSLSNYRFFKDTLSVTFQFLPQLIFIGCLFVYLCLMIIYKWTTFYVLPMNTTVGEYPSSHCAPSLLMGFINMFMFNNGRQDHFVDDKGDEVPQCNLSSFYWGQIYVERCLLMVAALSIPVMLFARPWLLKRQHERRIIDNSVRVDVNNDDAEVTHGGDGHGGDGPFDFGEVMIYQAIHTIEFALGCISHTASYLRLWALSLAHAQLSEVLWGMVLRLAFVQSNPDSELNPLGIISIYLIFFVFAVLTVCILVLMEGMSAFLHALRLHWVEFQTKFYGGTGYAFVPFSFDAILEAARAQETD